MAASPRTDGSAAAAADGVEYVDDEDEDDPDPDELKINAEFSKKLVARSWDEKASNLPKLTSIKEGEVKDDAAVGLRSGSSGSILSPARPGERCVLRM